MKELSKFLIEQKEIKGKSIKIDAYHDRRIKELNEVINQK